MKILDNLWYGMYLISLKSSLKDTPFALAAGELALYIHLAVFAISAFLSKSYILPFMYPKNTKPEIIGGVTIVLWILLYILYKKRGLKIIDNYKDKDDKFKKKKKTRTWIFMILVILAVYSQIFYKVGFPLEWELH